MILPFASCCHHVSGNPGGIFDCVFKFDKQISSVDKMSFYRLRWGPTSLPVIFRGLSMISLAHVVILCMLDLISHHFAPCRLPKMQQPDRKKRCDHITPVLASWHWLLFFFRTQFRILFVFKSLSGTVPPFLSKLLQPLTPARALRSTDQLLLETPRSRLKSRGDGAFSVMAHNLLKSLPFHDTWSF